MSAYLFIYVSIIIYCVEMTRECRFEVFNFVGKCRDRTLRIPEVCHSAFSRRLHYDNNNNFEILTFDIGYPA